MAADSRQHTEPDVASDRLSLWVNRFVAFSSFCSKTEFEQKETKSTKVG